LLNYKRHSKYDLSETSSLSDKDKKSRHIRSRSLSGSSESGSSRKNLKSKQREEKENIPWTKKTICEMTERDWRIFREDHDIIIKGGRVPYPIRSWSENDLPEYILKAIRDSGYKAPTSIQMQAIPIGLEKRDLIGLAPTGSGKSAAFLIPLIIYLNKLPPVSENRQDGPYSMILAPSRELAVQIYDEFKKFSKYTNLKAACLVGGRSAEEQAVQLGVGVEVIIGTPGRIQDTIERQFTTLNQCNYVIIDEADKMIKDGFEENLKFLLESIPATNLKSEDEKVIEEQEKECKLGIKRYRVTIMFSATMNSSLEKLARKYLRGPSYISIGEPGAGKKQIEQQVIFLDEHQKREKIRNILSRTRGTAMIFVNHKNSVDSLCKTLERFNFNVIGMHGGKSQDAREKALKGFKSGKYDVLVCTSLAARGIDVEGLSLVINYDCPKTIDDYTHRIGRTGRAGKEGTAITFLTSGDEEIFYDLREFLEHNKQHVPPELEQHPASKIKPGAFNEKVPRSKQVVYTA